MGNSRWPPFRRIVLRGTFNSLLNPKALLFLMVFLLQFVDIEAGGVTLQLWGLGGLLATIALVFHTALGVCASVLQVRVGRGRKGGCVGAYGLAAVMTALAARLLFLEHS
ncbi:LysE family transporter [Pseudomonas vanderleydeniana]|uniref:LysE family transporter n=1 Tax=Pseudomonas vanderleydeniana TaxID=2745495 RepID=UPI001CEC2902|nr:LysE family transporter [Pseudomonas vanderleydeniana]